MANKQYTVVRDFTDSKGKKQTAGSTVTMDEAEAQQHVSKGELKAKPQE
jgi:hypothetical protein